MNKKSILHCFLALSLFSAVMACKFKYDIPEKKMVAILVDFHLADGINDQGPKSHEIIDSLLIYGPILEKHGYTMDDFRRSIDQYMKNPRTFESIYNKVMKELTGMREQYAFAAPKIDEEKLIQQLSLDDLISYETSVKGDTTMVWW